MNPILLSILQQLLPLFLSTYDRFASAHPGAPVTVEGLTAQLRAEGDVILAEGAAWKAAHADD